jgi:hypothetical protein
MRRLKTYLLTSAALLAWACGKPDAPEADTTAFEPNGGSSGNGGSGASGGSSANGSGGSAASGGSSATSSGGTGGGATTGGTGGAAITGGAGGASGTGGGNASGGGTAAAGRAAGGANGMGGRASATGGAPNATGGRANAMGGGANDPGGAPSAGGNASGGSGTAGGSMGAAGLPNDPSWKPPDMTATAKLIVLYQAQQKEAMTYSIGMMLQLKNQTDTAYDLSKVTIRYWFSSEAAPMPRFDYTASGLSAASAPTFVGNMSNSYIQLSFKAGGTVPVYVDMNSLNNTNMSVAVQAQSNTGQFNQSGDWSFDSTASAYKANPKITVYDDGTLIWGCEPSHICAMVDDSGEAGASGM